MVVLSLYLELSLPFALLEGELQLYTERLLKGTSFVEGIFLAFLKNSMFIRVSILRLLGRQKK